MELGFYSANEVRHKRSPALAISVALHAAAFAGLMLSPAIELPQREKSEQVIAGKEDKLVWYKFDKELPEIRPPDVKADRRPVRAKSVAKQQMSRCQKGPPKESKLCLLRHPNCRIHLRWNRPICWRSGCRHGHLPLRQTL